jgi:hypothetical protein
MVLRGMRWKADGDLCIGDGITTPKVNVAAVATLAQIVQSQEL